MLAYPRVTMKKRDLMAFKQETWWLFLGFQQHQMVIAWDFNQENGDKIG